MNLLTIRAKHICLFIPFVGFFAVSCQSPQAIEAAKTQRLLDDSHKVAAQARAALGKVEILEQHDVTESGLTYVVGTARASEPVSYAEIDFGVLDSGGNRIGTAIANISNLSPATDWKFKALILQKEADSVLPGVVSAR